MVQQREVLSLLRELSKHQYGVMLDPNPENWEGEQEGAQEQPPQQPEQQPVDPEGAEEPGQREEGDGAPRPPLPQQGIRVVVQQVQSSSSDSGADSDPGDTSGEEDDIWGLPHGVMLQRYTFETDCSTCDDRLVTFSFAGTPDAAGVLGGLVTTRRIHPICQPCATRLRAEAALHQQRAAEEAAQVQQDQDGGR